MSEVSPPAAGSTGSVDARAAIAMMATDPPSVHDGAPGGVWAAAGDCLEFLATTVKPGLRTLETGCGATTIVFAASGAAHASVFLDESEGLAVQDWCAAHNISTAGIAFHPGSSSVTLPRLELGDLDLVMVDGCHGFPFPQLDWYYAASHLVTGGTLIIDDTQLAAPYELRRYLEHDPRWDRIHVGTQWVAFRRLGSGSLDEEWMSQRFHQPLALRGQAARRKARGFVGRLRRRVQRPGA